MCFPLRGWLRARVLARRREEYRPSPITFPTETNGKGLPREDFLRNMELTMTNPDFTGKGLPTLTVKAMFDNWFRQKLNGRPFILVNFSLIRDLQLDDRVFERYPDPENPPHGIETVLGTPIKAYGQFYAKMGPKGAIDEYFNQQIFLNPMRYMDVLCVAVEEACRFDVCVGYHSIIEHALDEPVKTLVAPIGSHDGSPRIDTDARNERILKLAAKKQDQERAQNAKEEKREEDRKQAGRSAET